MDHVRRIIIASMQPFLRRAALCGAVWLLLAAGVSPAFAAFEEDSAGARTRGLAGVLTAVADGSESLFGQPAGLALLQNPELALTYGKLLTGLSDGSNINNGMAAVAVPAGTRAGLGLGYKTLMLDAVYGETAVTGACGIRVGRGVSLGLAAKYLSLRYGTDAYTRQDPLLAAQAGVAAFDADAGVLWALTPAVTVAYARQNILGADIGLRERVQLTPCDRVALAYRESAFLISAEYVQTSRRTRYLAGMEKMFAHDLFGVRFGAGWGDREFRAIAAGLRANFRQFSVDYAFDIPAGGIDGTSGTHFVTLVARWSRPMTRAEKTSAPAAVVTQLPGMTAPEAAAVAASAAPLCSVPELLPPPTACLRTPLAASLNFELAQSSTVARIGAILEASTATVAAEPPRRMKKAAPAKRAAVTEPAASSAAVPSIVPAMASRPAGPARTCRVAAGDTLPGLAERYYGTKAAWPKIYQANKDRIEKGSLAPGEVLIIP